MAVCRGCRQPIRWEKTANGKAMPLNPEPREDGTVVLRGSQGVVIAHVLRNGEAPFEGENRFRVHWDGCPKAEQFRQRRAGRR